MQIKILGHNYNLTFEEFLARDDEIRGRWKGLRRSITIDSNIDMDLQVETLIHELIEALNYHLEIGLEHRQITILDAGLFQIFKDNPEIVDWIKGGRIDSTSSSS